MRTGLKIAQGGSWKTASKLKLTVRKELILVRGLKPAEPLGRGNDRTAKEEKGANPRQGIETNKQIRSILKS